MPAYCIFLMKNLRDRAKMEQYWATARNSFAGYNVKLLTGYKDYQIVEGDDKFIAVSLAEFDTYANAQTWYNSPEYAPFKKLRNEAGDYLTIIVDADGPPVPIDQRLRT